MAEAVTPGRRLTKGDLEVLAIIEAELQVRGRTPSLRELARKRGHKAHGPTQRVINRLLEAGKIHPDPEGGWQVRGLVATEPHTAELINAAEPTWVAAPAPGLLAWQLARDAEGLPAGTIVFVAPGKVPRFALCLGEDIEGVYHLHRAGYEVKNHRTGPATDGAGNYKLTLVGPVRYALISYRP